MLAVPCNDVILYLSNGWVFAQWNTISNVVYILCAFVGIGLYHRSNYSSNRRMSPMQVILLYICLGMLGISSTIYHITFQHWSLCLDYLTIQMFSFLLLWNFLHMKPWYREKLYWGGIVCVLGVTSLLLILSYLDETYDLPLEIVYNMIIGSMLTLNYLMYMYLVRKQEEKVKKYFRRSLGLFGVAMLFYLLGMIGCPKKAWWQPHAYWHICSGVSIYLLIRSLSYVK